MVKYALPLPGVMTYFLCFLRKLYQKLMAGKNLLCWLHKMLHDLIYPFTFKNWLLNVTPNLYLLFRIDNLSFAKSVISNIPLPPNFKLRTLFEFLTVKLMDDSVLKAHQAISDVKSPGVVLKCSLLFSKRHHIINPIYNILMGKTHLCW